MINPLSTGILTVIGGAIISIITANVVSETVRSITTKALEILSNFTNYFIAAGISFSCFWLASNYIQNSVHVSSWASTAMAVVSIGIGFISVLGFAFILYKAVTAVDQDKPKNDGEKADQLLLIMNESKKSAASDNNLVKSSMNSCKTCCTATIEKACDAAKSFC